MRASLRLLRAALRGRGATRISYSMKACPVAAVAGVLARGGCDASAASLGEVLAACRAGFPARRIQLHGNAKDDAELAGALRAGVGRIVVDGADEIDRLAVLTAKRRLPQPVWLRIAPSLRGGLRAAMIDSKFGATVDNGDALAQARTIARLPGVRLVGLHAHIGADVRDVERYGELAGSLVAFAHRVLRSTGVRVREIGVGGGVAPGGASPGSSLTRYVAAVMSAIRPDEVFGRSVVYFEPGRALVNRAGVALYRVVSRKEVPGVRTFVAVDGGAGDNLRPMLYGARYQALLADRPRAVAEETVAVVGRYSEGADVLVRAARLPRSRAGDVVALAESGAYALAMASNYNQVPRPAVVLVDRGRARVVRKRETFADLWRAERRT